MTDFAPIENRAVIICGHPKSGTTLLLALLDGHPELTVFPEELHFFQKVLNRPGPVDILFRETGFSVFRHDKVELASGERDYGDVDFQALRRQVEETCETATGYRDILTGAMSIWHRHQANAQGKKKRWVVKTPGSEQYLHLCRRWFGDPVIFLHMVRDPRDNFASYRIKQPQLTLDDFVENWTLSSEIALYGQARVPGYHVVRYEDLALDSGETLKKITKILAIGEDPSMRRPTKNGKPWSGNSMYGTKFSAISSSSVGRYHQQLPDSEIRSLEFSLQRQMNRLGYGVQRRGPRIVHLAHYLRAKLLFLRWYRSSRRMPFRDRIQSAG